MAICVTMKVKDAQERTDALTQQVASVQVQLAEAKQKALAMTANSYHDLYPDFYVTPPESNTVAEKNTVYLTFEDGPSERTPEILRILKKQEVKATFFVNGKTDAVSKQRMQAIVADGHTIGCMPTIIITENSMLLWKPIWKMRIRSSL